MLEVGCGPGDLWRANRERLPEASLTLADLSPGMVETARAAVGDRAEYAVADVQELPFADGAFDLAVANHMLYHVPDRPRALAELRRVLRPGGRLVAATNGDGHLRELDELARGVDRAGMRGFARFGLENGAGQLVEAGFAGVCVEVYEDALEVTEVAPLLAYLGSMAQLPDPEGVARIEREVAGTIARAGSFHVSKAPGLVRGRKP